MLQNIFERLTRKIFREEVPSQLTGVSDIQLLAENKNLCSWPNLYYGNVDTLARLIQAENILEIGVAWGYHAEHLLSCLPNIKYTGIDPYQSDYDSNDSFCDSVCSLFKDSRQSSMDRLYSAVKCNLENKFPDRVVMLRASSLNAIENLTNQFSLIFLDGDHRFENVKQELASFWPLVREGGLLVGDDYDWPDVKNAVDLFAKERSLDVHFISKESRGYSSYFFHKN
jgi:predicted O-methyltransferase YrrM